MTREIQKKPTKLYFTLRQVGALFWGGILYLALTFCSRKIRKGGKKRTKETKKNISHMYSLQIDGLGGMHGIWGCSRACHTFRPLVLGFSAPKSKSSA